MLFETTASIKFEPFKSGNLQINFEKKEVRKYGEKIELTHTEYSLIEYLAKNPETTVTHKGR